MKFWQSADKSVTKEVLQREQNMEIPSERAVCQIKVSNIQETSEKLEELQKKFQSDILYGSSEKSHTLGDACSELDRKIERALEHMWINETSLITIKIPYETESGFEEVSIKFELTLLKFEPFPPVYEWTPEEKYNISLKYKEVGVELFKSARYVDAFLKFSRACKFLITLEPMKELEAPEELIKKIGNLRVVLYNNMAECHLQRKNYEHVVSLCNKVLEREENNLKALYRRGVAYGNLDQLENALEDLEKVLKLDPNNSLAKAKYNLFKPQFKVANKNYEHIVKRMFGTDK